jgi:large repetitive protein
LVTEVRSGAVPTVAAWLALGLFDCGSGAGGSPAGESVAGAAGSAGTTTVPNSAGNAGATATGRGASGSAGGGSGSGGSGAGQAGSAGTASAGTNAGTNAGGAGGAPDLPVTVTPPAGSGTWTQAAALPDGRQDASGAVVDGRLFIVGGRTPTTQNAVSAYDPKADKWETQPAVPVLSVNHGNVGSYNGKLYFFGGRAINEAYVFDPSAKKWSPIKALPAPRESAVVATIANKIYIVGGGVSDTFRNPAGAHDSANAEMFAYDPATDSYETLAPMPEAKTHAAGAVINGILYVAAGRKWVEAFPEPEGWSKTLFAYDPVANKWTQKADAPTSRSGCVGAELNGLLIVGGAEPGPTAVLEAYNPQKDDWVKLKDMPVARNGQAQVNIGGNVYFAAGTRPQTDVLSLP